LRSAELSLLLALFALLLCETFSFDLQAVALGSAVITHASEPGKFALVVTRWNDEEESLG
jgi:hypothetical protein